MAQYLQAHQKNTDSICKTKNVKENNYVNISLVIAGRVQKEEYEYR